MSDVPDTAPGGVGHITACPDCGSTRFAVSETYVHDAEVRDDGVLFYKSWPDGGGRDGITCAECERAFDDDDFVAVEYD